MKKIHPHRHQTSWDSRQACRPVQLTQLLFQHIETSSTTHLNSMNLPGGMASM
jgi:hypothetical protein